jgi:protein-S-isoprenylcysteine O-methyltransferase Ste14
MDVVVALVWAVLVGAQAASVMRAPTWSGAVLVGANALVGALFLLRRPAAARVQTWDLLLVPLGLFLPTLWRAAPEPGWLAAGVELAGALLVAWSVAALGRSFGLFPARRGVVAAGPYRLVRHPMYVAQALTGLGVGLAGGPDALAWNWPLWVAFVLVQAARAVREERVLRADPAYQGYAARVRWRLAPGVW